jgi:hypothetical protein
MLPPRTTQLAAAGADRVMTSAWAAVLAVKRPAATRCTLRAPS